MSELLVQETVDRLDLRLDPFQVAALKNLVYDRVGRRFEGLEEAPVELLEVIKASLQEMVADECSTFVGRPLSVARLQSA